MPGHPIIESAIKPLINIITDIPNSDPHSVITDKNARSLGCTHLDSNVCMHGNMLPCSKPFKIRIVHIHCQPSGAIIGVKIFNAPDPVMAVKMTTFAPNR